MRVIILTVVIAIISVLIMWGGFVLNRWFNYKFGYGTKVENTIANMVKPECLKEIRNE